MKKLLLTLAVLVFLLVAVWLGASWFIGLHTEKQVRQHLQASDGQHALIDYQRSLLHSRVETRLNVSQTPLGQWVDDLPLVHEVTHGPIVGLSEHGLGLFRWQTHLDKEALDESVSGLVDEAFFFEPPFLLEARADFDQVLSYQVDIPPLKADSEESGLSFFVDGLQINGQWAAQSSESPKTTFPATFKATTGALALADNEVTIAVPSLSLSQSDAGDVDEVTLEVVGASVSSTEEPEPITFNLTGHVTTEVKETDLQGEVALSLNQFSGLTYPLQQLDFTLDFSGIHQPALAEINRLQNYMQDLQVQLSVGEEEMELPEARRQLTQLDIELRDAANQLLAVLFKKALQVNKTRLNYEFKVAAEQGDIVNTAKLHYAGTNKPVVLADLVDNGVEGLIRFIRGDITLKAVAAALPIESGLLLSYPLERKGLVESGGEYRMDLRLLKSDMELNGRVIKYGELWGKFMPTSIVAAGERRIPDDVWDLVETQGLSDELIKKLESREDISAESLDILKQLQEASRVLQD